MSSRVSEAKMEGKEKRQEVAAMKARTASSSDESDSDVERNFALLTKRGGGGRGGGGGQDEKGEPNLSGGEEEEEFSDNEDMDQEEEEESGGSEEEQQEEEEVSEDEEDDDDDDDGDDNNPAEGSGEIQTTDDIKKELSSMSFEDIMKLQNKVGTKAYSEIAYGSSSSKTPSSNKKKRLNKNRPMEISSKKPTPFLRQVVPVKKANLRDPRFDDLSGEYKPEIFEKTYKFINDIKWREKEIIQKQLKKTKKNSQKKEKLQFLLKRMENQERARTSREQQRERELQFKQQQRELAKQGLRPFFINKSEKKKLQLADKYTELKKSGKLENFLSKKRKRNAGKDRRKLPQQH
ncbi:hypothetical protein LDENG_00123450 [Lucifuga dentata]|nr:hypothetical protein LDENG_00123450 [Lucifuga dentata]